jgi:hypothetical protein
VEFLPKNTTSLLQPMDQTVIANFKKGYMKLMFKCLFEHCEQAADTSKDAVFDFWKNGYDIRMAVAMILKAWKYLTERALAGG